MNINEGNIPLSASLTIHEKKKGKKESFMELVQPKFHCISYLSERLTVFSTGFLMNHDTNLNTCIFHTC